MMVGAGVLIDGVPAFSAWAPGPMRADRRTSARGLRHRIAALLPGVTCHPSKFQCLCFQTGSVDAPYRRIPPAFNSREIIEE